MIRPTDAARSRRYEVDPTCRCGCPRETHQHYRDATDCGRCGRVRCPSYVDRRLSNLDCRDLGLPVEEFDLPLLTRRDRVAFGTMGIIFALAVGVLFCVAVLG